MRAREPCGPTETRLCEVRVSGELRPLKLGCPDVTGAQIECV